MALDRTHLMSVFTSLGATLAQPTTLCIFGSAPGILLGQPSRQTEYIDVWNLQSDYDAGDLAKACAQSELLFDPQGELDPNAVYIQIVRPGIVALPNKFEMEAIERFGKLSLSMPVPAVLSAAKLVRGSENDVNDITWWVKTRQLSLEEIEDAIEQLPQLSQRETARKNLIYIHLIAAPER